MDSAEIRRTLLGQHEQIRAHLNGCSVLARRLLGGAPVQGELDAALTRLRADFIEHNIVETALVRPLLGDAAGRGALLVDRMFEEHVAEHAAFWQMLAGPAQEVAGRMDDLVDELDAHMAAEERTFLSPQALHVTTLPR